MIFVEARFLARLTQSRYTAQRADGFGCIVNRSSASQSGMQTPFQVRAFRFQVVPVLLRVIISLLGKPLRLALLYIRSIVDDLSWTRRRSASIRKARELDRRRSRGQPVAPAFGIL